MQDNPEQTTQQALSTMENKEPSERAVGDEALTQSPESTANAVEARMLKLESDLAAMEDQFLRSRAEMENMRRRHIEEMSAAQKYAINKFATELLSVSDSLEMALADQSEQVASIKMGVELTLKQLMGAFEHAQIKDINPVGELLDPHKHQAISSEVADKPPNTILRVMQKGYSLADRLLRPAIVVVAKKE